MCSPAYLQLLVKTLSCSVYSINTHLHGHLTAFLWGGTHEIVTFQLFLHNSNNGF